MKNLIKYGTYAGAVIAIGSVLSFIYNINTWSADVEELKSTQAIAIYEMELRQLSRELKLWITKPASNPIEELYIESIVEELKSDRADISSKIRSINLITR